MQSVRQVGQGFPSFPIHSTIHSQQKTWPQTVAVGTAIGHMHMEQLPQSIESWIVGSLGSDFTVLLVEGRDANAMTSRMALARITVPHRANTFSLYTSSRAGFMGTGSHAAGRIKDSVKDVARMRELRKNIASLIAISKRDPCDIAGDT